MCIPLLPLALSGLAGGLTFLGNKQAQNAQNRRLMAEKSRQTAFTNQQQGRFEDTLEHARDLQDPAEQERASAARNSALAAVIAPQASPGAYLPGSSSAPSVVKVASDRSSAARHVASSALAAALARLGGTGDQVLATNIASGRNASAINQIGSFKAGSASVLDAELQAAAQKGSFLRGLGSLAQQLGMAMAGAPEGLSSAGGISDSILKAKSPFLMPKTDIAALLHRLPPVSI